MTALGAVTARGITKLYGRHRALGGVDLTLRPGQLCALLGPNGAGKSTLVGILSTLIRATSGSVVYEGAGEGGAALDAVDARPHIGVLAHEPFLYGELSAEENLRFWAKLYDLSDADGRAKALLDRVGLEPQARTRPARTYSRGMLQRLALARALMHDPGFLLLDEPFTGLDHAGVKALGEVLAESRRVGRIVLVVSHDLEAIGGLCDHLVVLRRGKIVLDETRAEPFSQAELKAMYVDAEEAPVRGVLAELRRFGRLSAGAAGGSSGSGLPGGSSAPP